MKIKHLNNDTILKIAAGEVIQNPYSVVKELIDNAIDSKATTIMVQLLNNGMTAICVNDNGCGMSKEDLPLSLLPNYTSKISKYDDISALETLGFRGEALHSISACSLLKISSRASEEDICYCVDNDKEEVYNDTTVFVKGTKVLVCNLFHNMPVRRQFLEKNIKNISNIKKLIKRYALAYPHISFSLEHNNKMVLTYYGAKSLQHKISSVLSTTYIKNMKPINYKHDFFEISGFVGNIDIATKSRNNQYLHINNRIVEENPFLPIIEKVCRNYIPSGLYPSFVIDLFINPDKLDPNCHPSKDKVAFYDFEEVQNGFEIALKQFITQNRFADLFIQEEVLTETVEQNNSLISLRELEENAVVVCQLMDTYILIKSLDKTILLDQHAIHEKVIYDKLKESLSHAKLNPITLDIPIAIHLSNAEHDFLISKAQTLSQIGFEFEEFGVYDLLINKIPFAMSPERVKTLLIDIVKEDSNEDWLEKTLISISCRAAIKANTALTMDNMKSLVNFFFKNEVSNCPHGRPAYSLLENKEIEKKFKRII